MTDDTFIANLIDEAVELHTTIATLESQLSAEQKQKIAALVLAAAASGAPGPLVAHFAGADTGALTIPLMIIPGSLDREAIATKARNA